MTKPTNDILGRDYDRALAQATLADETVQDELSALANPRLAEMQGVTKKLITAGTHEPTGSTVTASGAFDGAIKPSTKRYDARDKRDAGLQGFEAYIVVSGSYGKVKDALKGFAEAHGKDTLIGGEQGREIGLTEKLTNNEVAHLVRYGATCLTGNKQPITLNNTATAPAATV